MNVHTLHTEIGEIDIAYIDHISKDGYSVRVEAIGDVYSHEYHAPLSFNEFSTRTCMTRSDVEAQIALEVYGYGE